MFKMFLFYQPMFVTIQVELFSHVTYFKTKNKQ